MVEAFPVAKDFSVRFRTGAKTVSRLAIDSLGLQGRQQTFRTRVILAIADGSHGHFHVRRGASLSKLERRVLRTMIRVMNDWCGTSSSDRYLPGTHHPFGILPGGH